jgi:hypothetical protein
MSGSLPADVILEPRLGPRSSKNRGRTTVGSAQPVYFDVRDRNTGDLVPGATGVAGIYWLPGTVGQDSEAQPLSLVEISPGTWMGLVPVDLPGTFTVWGSIETPSRQTAEIVFDATSLGNIPVSTGTPAYSAVQAVAAAAAASATAWLNRHLQPQIDGQADRLAALEALTSYVEPVIAAFAAAPSLLEVGASAASVTLTVTRNRMDLPVTITGSSTATIPAGEPSVAVPGPFTAAAAWTATVTDPAPPPGQNPTATAPAALAFRLRSYRGAVASPAPSDAEIRALADALGTGRVIRETTIDCGSGAYIVLVFPTAWGAAPDTIDLYGLPVDAISVTQRAVVNAAGAAIPCHVIVTSSQQYGAVPARM